MSPTALRHPKKKVEAQEVEPDVAEHEEEMLKRAANQQGEGRLP